MKENGHGKIIAAAAKTHLSPLGCFRKGRSRVWYYDEALWLIGVEFEPSAWSRGSYLNAGVQWLWYPHDGFMYQSGGRVDRAPFIRFETAVQFQMDADHLASLAATEVQRWRDAFPSLGESAAHVLDRADGRGYSFFNGAVAAGLLGRPEDAERLFSRFLEIEPSLTGEKSKAWEIERSNQAQEARNFARRLMANLQVPETYRHIVLELTMRAREVKRLQPDEQRIRVKLDEMSVRFAVQT